MPRGTGSGRHKYVPLQRYLLALAPEVQELTLPFPAMEQLLGAPLPPSAGRPSYWTGGTVARNWHRVGFAAHYLRVDHAVRFTRRAPGHR
jgi:hypothetical protein